MESGAINRTRRSRNSSSYERLVAIGLGLLAVVSPLYVDYWRTRAEQELEEEPVDLSSYLPLLPLLLILTIIVLSCVDQLFPRFDPYWIFRVGGSSTGLVIMLMVLLFILKCKTSGFSDC